MTEEGQMPQEGTISVEQAGEVLGVSRNTAYALAREFLATGGASGLPVLRLGARRMRVPVRQLEALLSGGGRSL